MANDLAVAFRNGPEPRPPVLGVLPAPNDIIDEPVLDFDGVVEGVIEQEADSFHPQAGGDKGPIEMDLSKYGIQSLNHYLQDDKDYIDAMSARIRDIKTAMRSLPDDQQQKLQPEIERLMQRIVKDANMETMIQRLDAFQFTQFKNRIQSWLQA